MSVALDSALREFKESAGLDLVSVVSADGLLIDSAHDDHIDAEAIATLAASGMLMMDSLGRELGQGPATDVILEYRDSMVILSPLTDETVLVAVGKGSINLGRVRLLLRRSVDRLVEAVQNP